MSNNPQNSRNAQKVQKRRMLHNPLLQPTEGGINLPSSPTLSEEQMPAVLPTAPQKKLSDFEANHDRMTAWIASALKTRFDQLCAQQGRGSKTRLMDEAISDLLRKYKAK